MRIKNISPLALLFCIQFDSAVNRELLNKAKDEAKKREENEKNSAFFDTISELEDNKG